MGILILVGFAIYTVAMLIWEIRRDNYGIDFEDSIESYKFYPGYNGEDLDYGDN